MVPELPSPATDVHPIDASRYVGTYGSRVADSHVTQDADGRIWIEQKMKGIFAGLAPISRRWSSCIGRATLSSHAKHVKECTHRTLSSAMTATATHCTCTPVEPTGGCQHERRNLGRLRAGWSHRFPTRT